MARRRKFQWIDAIQSTLFNVVGAAAPGTVVSNAIVAETEVENVGGGATLMRVVGDIFWRSTAGTPVATATLFLFQPYLGAARPTDWDNDTFQRATVLGTWMAATVTGGSETMTHTRIDLGTKRKLTQGMELDLEIQNHSTAGNDFAVAFHLRALLLLP